MPRRKRSIDEVLADTCGACHKSFKTSQGLCAHQSTSKRCAWYKKGKLREVFDFSAAQGGDMGEESIDIDGVRWCILTLIDI